MRVRQFVQPTGWHYNHRNGTQIYNRGHLIAYSISAGIDQDGNYNPNNQSGDQNNPKNLFTQSAYSNQKIQAISTDGSLDFNVYLFNVQPRCVYNYNDGRAKIDRQMIVKQ